MCAMEIAERNKVEIEQAKAERDQMREILQSLHDDAIEVKSLRKRCIVIITGKMVPPPTAGEDVFEIAKAIINEVTNVDVDLNELKEIHRTGAKGKDIPVDFILLHKVALLTNPVHNSKKRDKGTYINIHQRQSDRKLLYIARKLREDGLVDKFRVNDYGLTVVWKDDRKVVIRKKDDFKKIKSKDLSVYQNLKK